MGLRNLGDMNDVGVHAADGAFPPPPAPDDAAAGLGDRWPDGVWASGVEARGVAGMEMSSVSGLSSIGCEAKCGFSGESLLVLCCVSASVGSS